MIFANYIIIFIIIAIYAFVCMHIIFIHFFSSAKFYIILLQNSAFKIKDVVSNLFFILAIIFFLI